jgi:hypothetical protein
MAPTTQLTTAKTAKIMDNRSHVTPFMHNPAIAVRAKNSHKRIRIASLIFMYLYISSSFDLSNRPWVVDFVYHEYRDKRCVPVDSVLINHHFFSFYRPADDHIKWSHAGKLRHRFAKIRVNVPLDRYPVPLKERELQPVRDVSLKAVPTVSLLTRVMICWA